MLFGPMVAAGLCEDCEHARTVASARGSVFRRCLEHDRDPRYAKYPRLPVLECAAYRKAVSRRPAPGR